MDWLFKITIVWVLLTFLNSVKYILYSFLISILIIMWSAFFVLFFKKFFFFLYGKEAVILG